MTLQELVEYVDEQDGDLIIAKVTDDSSKVDLLGVCASQDDIHDMNLESGEYIVFRAIEFIQHNK